MGAERRNAGEAYKLGQAGENAPDWVLNDPSGHFLRQFELGQANPAKSPPAPAPAGPPTPPPPGGAGPSGRGRPPRRPGAKPPTKPPADRRGGRASGALGTLGAARSTPLPAPVRRAVPIPGGDVGGLLLVVALYPLGLSIVKYGAAGPGIWLRAKFLNIAHTPPPAAPAPPQRSGGVQHPRMS